MYQVGYRIGRLKSNKPIIEPVRVTDLRWSPEAKNLQEANFVAHHPYPKQNITQSPISASVSARTA